MTDLVDTFEGNGIREQFIEAAIGEGYEQAEIDKYINEAEHQDGDAHWDNFSDADEALEDFELYSENCS